MNQQTDGAPTRAIGLLLFLLLLNILNMVDRTLITSFGTAIINDLNLSDSQFGMLTGPIFVSSTRLWAYLWELWLIGCIVRD